MTRPTLAGLPGLMLVPLLLVACGGGGGSSSDSDTGEDVTEDSSTDAGEDATSDTDDDSGDDTSSDTTTDPEPDADAAVDGDADPDVAPDADAGPVREPMTFALNWPIFPTPADPLADAEVDSCAVYEEEVCTDGTVRRCDIYNADDGEFVSEPDDLLRRAYLYDRWYDLYSQPDGQTAERVFTEPMPPGTDESVWGADENLAGWAGAGDSGIWTGTALNGFIMRYLHTGTEADYQRMEEKVRVMVRFFEVTGIPGYLARYHYLRVPEGTPQHPDHIYRYEPDDREDHRDIENPEQYDWLPDHYFDGTGTPRWSGDPSIDQMNGPMVAFPMVYPLLRDEELQEDIAYQMTCYLHRLRRIEVRNLQDNDEALQAVNDFFAGDGLDTDPGDIDFSTIDDIVFYVHPQINSANEDIYDRECGDFIQLEPWRVIDASSSTFVLDMLELTQDIDREQNRRNHINHFYIPTIRGGDAIHLMHLALMAYAFTEDERYVDFLRDELLTNIGTAEVADVMSALINPRYCRKFFGTNIIAGPLWSFSNLLAESELDTHIQEVMHEELWSRECADIGNANCALMFAGAVSEAIGGEDREEALRQIAQILPQFGGNGGILDDPRRTYQRTFDEVVAEMDEGNSPRCPTEDERAICERDLSLFGFMLEGETISFECTGASSECVMEDGMCTTAEADLPLRPDIRRWGDYQWQRNPFTIGDSRGDALRQSPGSDYTEQYWMARFYDFIEGDRQVLAWRDTEVSCE